MKQKWSSTSKDRPEQNTKVCRLFPINILSVRNPEGVSCKDRKGGSVMRGLTVLFNISGTVRDSVYLIVVEEVSPFFCRVQGPTFRVQPGSKRKRLPVPAVGLSD